MSSSLACQVQSRLNKYVNKTNTSDNVFGLLFSLLTLFLDLISRAVAGEGVGTCVTRMGSVCLHHHTHFSSYP